MTNTITHDGLELCTDCTMLVANGDAASDEHAERVAALWPGLNTLVLSCDEDCEGWFSWRPCDGCGSTLGGDRHPAVAFDCP